MTSLAKVHPRRALCLVVATAWAETGWAQSASANKVPVRRIGLLWLSAKQPSTPPQLETMLRELRARDGSAVEVVAFYGDGAALAQQAAQLVTLKVDLIVAMGTPAAMVAKGATASIPIVYAIAADPVDAGLAATLARPGGNATGVYSLVGELSGKRLAMLHDAAPRAKNIGLLWTPHAANTLEFDGAAAAAQSLKLSTVTMPVNTRAELVQSLAQMPKRRIAALCVLTAPLILEHLRLVADTALQQRLPAMAGYSQFAQLGGLMSYSANAADTLRSVLAQVDKIIKGASPKDIPVQRAQAFELRLNLKTAAALKLALPPSLTALAQQLIR